MQITQQSLKSNTLVSALKGVSMFYDKGIHLAQRLHQPVHVPPNPFIEKTATLAHKINVDMLQMEAVSSPINHGTISKYTSL